MELACPCSLKYLWKFRPGIQVGLPSGENPYQRVSAVLTRYLDQSTSLDIYMLYIADGSPFHKESNCLEAAGMIKNSPEKQILSESDPVYFSLVFSMILRSYNIDLQVSPFEVRLEQLLKHITGFLMWHLETDRSLIKIL